MPKVLPQTGMSHDQVMEALEGFRVRDIEKSRARMTYFGMIGTDEIAAVSREAFLTYFHDNAIFTNRGFPLSLSDLENEVVAMGISILHGGSEARGVFTSGGSESNFLAVLAIREWAKQERKVTERPQIVAPFTGHPTIDKAAYYLGMEVHRVPVGPDGRADVAAMEAAITDRTVALAGSAVCWPFGLFDPIGELASIAQERGLWMHVDACVGGYAAPFAREAGYPIPDFDFSVPGVCSISADLHKYGRTPKPASTVFFRDAELREFKRFQCSAWPGGTYEVAGLMGSRPGGAIAAAWAVMHLLGEEGYVELARRTMEMKARLVGGLREIEGLEVQDTDLFVQTYGSSTLDIGAIAKGMTDRGHFMPGITKPPLVHLLCDPLEDAMVDEYLEDLAEVTAEVRSGRATGTQSVSYM